VLATGPTAATAKVKDVDGGPLGGAGGRPSAATTVTEPPRRRRRKKEEDPHLHTDK
jgi:hypothetical protein